MHQLNIATFSSQIVWTILGMIFVFSIVKKILMPTFNDIDNLRHLILEENNRTIAELTRKKLERQDLYEKIIESIKEKHKDELNNIYYDHMEQLNELHKKYNNEIKQIMISNQNNKIEFDSKETANIIQFIKEKVA